MLSHSIKKLFKVKFKTMRFTFTTIFSVLLFSISIAQDFDRAKMDKLFSIVEEHEQGMGSFSIYQDGQEVYSKAIGFLDINSKKLADENTVYRIGSISKSFTACIIMKLVEGKKLKLNTPLSRFFPKVKNSSQITVEQMLRHRSGIYNFTNTDEYLAYMENPLSRDEVVQKIIEFGSSFDPDEDADYSNSNYVLLSIIAEKVTKKSFSDLVEEMIVKPIGLKHTYYGGKINSANNEANSFEKLKVWESTTETDMTIPIGAGAIVSTPSDLNTFWKAFHNNEIVSDASKTKMMLIKDGFGIGLLQIPFNDKKAYGHNGGIDGFQSMSYHFPKENISISYTANAVLYPVNSLMIDALRIYFGKNADLPEFLPVMKLSKNDLLQYLGLYASPNIPLDITISTQDGVLMAQATGQKAFPLDAIDIHKFKFDPARINMEFFPEEGKMIMNQNGKEYTFQVQ